MHQEEVWTRTGLSDDASGSVAQARQQLLGLAGALVVLAILLPRPAQVVRTLAGHGRAGVSVADTSMLLAAAIAVWLLLAWLLLVAGVGLLGRMPGVIGRYARRVLRWTTPAAVRNVVLTVVGMSVLTGVAACGAPENSALAAAPAASGIAVEGSAIRLASQASELVNLDWPASEQESAPPVGRASGINLDWPTTRADPGHVTARAPVSVDWPASASSRTVQPIEGVVVHRGDSLWTIAARHLPARSSPAEIETAWHQWYSTNRAVIGNNPNLILPGQLLLPPNPGTGDRS